MSKSWTNTVQNLLWLGGHTSNSQPDMGKSSQTQAKTCWDTMRPHQQEYQKRNSCDPGKGPVTLPAAHFSNFYIYIYDIVVDFFYGMS